LKPATLARAFVIAAALCCAACAQLGLDSIVAPPAPPPRVDPKTEMTALEQRIFEIVQDERHKNNPDARPLALDSELVGIARERSADMAENNYMAHTSPEGVTSASLIMDQDQDFQGLLGENLAAQTFSPATGVNVDVFAHRFVDTWLASPAHKDNILYIAYDRSGVGAAVSEDTVYVTLLLATDLGLSHAKDPKKRQVTEWKTPQSATAPSAPSPSSAAPALRGTSPGGPP
jgi:uncharacterized protein YkwD